MQGRSVAEQRRKYPLYLASWRAGWKGLSPSPSWLQGIVDAAGSLADVAQVPASKELLMI